MSIYALQNIIRGEASKLLSGKNYVSIGKLISYEPTAYVGIVELYPSGDDAPPLQTGWIPIFSPWVGNAWGLFAPPNLGDMVEVIFQEGSLQNGYIGMRSYSNVSPPLPVQAGEFWIVHKSGSSLKFKNDGTIEINSSSGVEIGNVSDSLLQVMNSIARDVFNEHTHLTPDGESDPPTQQMGDGTLTSNLSAN